MAETINVTKRLDREIKKRAENLFQDLGMNLSTAFNVFAQNDGVVFNEVLDLPNVSPCACIVL